MNLSLVNNTLHLNNSNGSSTSFDGGGGIGSDSGTVVLTAATAAMGGTAADWTLGSTDSVDLSNLYPAVIECFLIILCGYFAGRSNLISQTEAKGLNTFVSHFSLPALIFMSMAKLDFSTVNWLFLLGICLAKVVVFVLVAVITLLAQRPADYGKAGLYAIFCTQSNDFALGYPIVAALYNKSHPDFPSYLYLLAPISLVLLNPVGFVLMEIGKKIKEDNDNRSSGSSSSSSSSSSSNMRSRSNNRLDASSSSNISSDSSFSHIANRNNTDNVDNSDNINTNNTNNLVGGTNTSRNRSTKSRGDNPRNGSNSRGKRPKSCLKQRLATTNTGRRCSFAGTIFKGVLLNPVVMMTLLGMLGNVVFAHKLPELFNGVLQVLGQAFSASALFSLGVRMVGKVGTLRGPSLVLPGILIAVKTMMLPLVAREFVSLLQPGGGSHNTTVDYSNFAFLYGTFPTAPSVFVYAAHYNVQPDLIASSMVAVTFLSAPLMLVSAKMVTLTRINPMHYVAELETFLFNISVVGVVATVWVVVVFLAGRRWRRVPHCITLCLAVSQCMAAVGALLWSVVDCNHTWKLYLQFTLVTWGVFSSRVFTALLAVTLFLLRWRSLAFVMRLRPFFALLGFGVPGILVLVLVLVVQRETDIANKHDPNFQYGTTQAVVALLLLWFCLFTTIVCLILQQRQQRRYDSYSPLSHARLREEGESSGLMGSELPTSDCSEVEENDSDSPNEALRSDNLPEGPSNAKNSTQSELNHTDVILENTNGTSIVEAGQWNGAFMNVATGASTGNSLGICLNSNINTNTQNTDEDGVNRNATESRSNDAIINDISSVNDVSNNGPSHRSVRNSRSRHSRSNQRRRSSGGGGRGRSGGGVRVRPRVMSPGEDGSGILRDRDDEFQMMRHVVLLLFLCGSMTVGFGLCLWTLVTEEVTGVYVEMVFLDAVLNYGQGFFTAIIFALDTQTIILPLLRLYRRLVYGSGAVQLPPLDALPTEDRTTCDQFTSYHLHACQTDIVRDRRWRLKELHAVFGGQELVDWLLLVGLANDRTHAVRYGRALLLGRVIRHIDDLHHFYDQPLFYTFCEPASDTDP